MSDCFWGFFATLKFIPVALRNFSYAYAGKKKPQKLKLNLMFDKSKESLYSPLCLGDILKMPGFVEPREDHDLQLYVTGNWKYFKI